jgi:cell division inhibitor SepF
MGFSEAVRSIKNIWGHGDDEEFDADRTDRNVSSSYEGWDEDDNSASDSYGSAPGSGASAYSASEGKYTSSVYPTKSSYGSGGSTSLPPSASRLRAVNPTLRAREKNIYTIKPKRLDEATVAADCLKTGSAVIVNLEAVDRVTAVRIVDFMSGVCYGIDGADGQPGHAMKLGEMIFLFTPSEFEITSDETDYAANRDHFFREISEQNAPPAAPGAPAPGGSFASSYNTPVDYAAERRAWER